MKSSMKTTAEPISTNKANGIYFCGVVSQRRKRMVPKDNPTATVVTYEFTDEATNVTYYVDDYEPDTFLEQGQYVEVPVRVKAYVNKSTNRPAFSMTIKKAYSKDNNDLGEVF